MVNPESTVGQLVVERPARARVFQQFGIDFCCGGKRPLQDACAAGGIDIQAVLEALQSLDTAVHAAEPDWTTTTLAQLIANILERHHAYLRAELPRLGQMAARVRDVHGPRHRELVEVYEVYSGLKAELEMHMMKEERILFPLIESMESAGLCAPSHCGSVQNPIRVMEHEHDSAGSALERLRALTGGYAPPADACNTFRALLSGLAELESDLHEHIHKENNILFPRATELEAGLRSEALTGRPN